MTITRTALAVAALTCGFRVSASAQPTTTTTTDQPSTTTTNPDGTTTTTAGGTTTTTTSPDDPAGTTTTPPTPPAPIIIQPPDPVVIAPPAPAPRPINRTIVVPVERAEPERYGIALTLGGGVIGFTDETTRDTIDLGGAWEARMTAGTRSPLALEAAYIGSAQSVDALGVDGDAILLGSGVEAAARLNLIPGAIQPYVLAGAGWTRYDLTNTDTNTSDVADEDDVFQLPLGAGLAFHQDGMVFDVRAVYRPTTDADLLDAAGTDARLDTWSAAVRGGFEF